LFGVTRLELQELEKLGKDLGADAFEGTVLELEVLRLFHEAEEFFPADLVQVGFLFVQCDTLVVCSEVDRQHERDKSVPGSERGLGQEGEDCLDGDKGVDACALERCGYPGEGWQQVAGVGLRGIGQLEEPSRASVGMEVASLENG
jgi:hypothetical protein